MALNRETLNDEDGDSSDWIEIHNPDTAAQTLEGWFLTDDPANLTRWRFPANVWLSPGEFLVVFASGKDKTAVPGRLHTNFRLAQSGEFLALLDPQTNIVSQFSPLFPPQLQDVSYGRDAVDPSITGFFPRATPGAQNVPGGPGFAPEVQFSRPSGTFATNAPFVLALSVPAENATIHYELGTNTPGTSSPIYTGPIPINNTTLVRARAFQPGLLPGPISARTYIGLSDQTNVLNFRSHLPIIVLHNHGQGQLPTSRAARTLLMQVFEPGNQQASLTDTPTMVERGTFHLRGDATLTYPKGSFTIEIRDELDEDKDVELLGMPAESDWLLIAPNFLEPGLINNPLAYQLARDLGQYASRTRLVEVYLKDDSGAPGPITAADYNGIYTLMEKIKRNPNRVDIDKLEREHVAEPEISGGYMFTIDRAEFGEPNLNAGGASMRWIEPHPLEMTNVARGPQIAYVSSYFNAMAAAINGPDYTNANPPWAAFIDMDSWITRHIHEVLTFNVDALRLSTFFYKPRGEPIHFGPAFDYDRSQSSSSADSRSFNPRTWRSTTGDLGSDFFNHTPWWGRLFRAPDFWQRWIDRYQEYRQGPLALPNILNHIQRLAGEVAPAHAREVARWNVPPRSNMVTIAGFTHNFGNNGYENEVRWYGVWYSNRLHFMDTQFLARPFLSRRGGITPPGEVVSLYSDNPSGTPLYYTLDGTDPRLPGGAISPTAFSSDSGAVNITISNTVRIVARAWDSAHRNLTGPNNPPLSSPWSGVISDTFYTHVPQLRITEIMYHPADPETAEFLEVKNIGFDALNLAGFTLSGGVEFTFPAVVLQSQQSAVIVADLAAFQARYGSQPLVLGVYSNRLDNAGERLVLRGPMQEPILDFRYEDDWYPITDGFGFSLVIENEHGETDEWNLKGQWHPSGAVHGSPGADDVPGPALPRVVVNELRLNPDELQPARIELRNLSSSTADISGWFLTDDLNSPKKYLLPQGTTIPGGGYRTIMPFLSLNDLGDEVYLFAADTSGNLAGYFDGFKFGALDEDNRDFGRHVLSTGEADYFALTFATFGAANAAPVVGPLVIQEIHYHPPDFVLGSRVEDNARDEFIELRNISTSSVALHDLQNPANTWRLAGAVQFAFPQSVLVAAGGLVLIVPFDPADEDRLEEFRSRYDIPLSVWVLGPYHGKLDNTGASVELLAPDAPRANSIVPYITVDRIAYSDTAPWPGAADGFTPSLQRIDASAYGNDPANWFAAIPTPGEGHGDGELPVITTHPQSQTVVAHTDVTLSVTAEGTDLRYQWVFKGALIYGATNSSLLLSDVQPWQQGTYAVVVIGAGGGAVVSGGAFLTVLLPPTILSQPQSVLATIGARVAFSVHAFSSTRIEYQWFHDGQEITGAISAVYEIAAADVQHSGVYRVRLTDSIGSVLSAPATLTLLIPPTIVKQPLSQEVPRGGAVTLSVEVTNSAALPVGYRWRHIGATIVSNSLQRYQDFLVVSNIQAASNFTVVVYNIARPVGLLSDTATVTAIDDSDQDGMPDVWEVAYNLQPGNPADAADDPDNDDSANLDEYLAGTDPRDPLSYLKVRLQSVTPQLTRAVLQFSAVSNRTYSVEYRPALNVGNWQKLADVVAVSSNRVVEITDRNAAAGSRYYRLVTPRQP